MKDLENIKVGEAVTILEGGHVVRNTCVIKVNKTSFNTKFGGTWTFDGYARPKEKWSWRRVERTTQAHIDYVEKKRLLEECKKIAFDKMTISELKQTIEFIEQL